MEKIKIPYGESDYKTLIEENYIYVDKTMYIETLENHKKAIYVRPRRFGKSLMISTIDEFFNVEKKDENKNLFKGLYIEKNKYKKEQGQYPVINLNLKRVEADNWETMYEKIKILFQNLYAQYLDLRENLNETQLEQFNSIIRSEREKYVN